MIKREYLPGWLVMLVVSVISLYASGLIVMGGKHPLEAPVIAIVLGILASNVGLVPRACGAGVKAFEGPLIWGIVLMGAGLDFRNIAGECSEMLLVIVVTMLVGFFGIYYLAKACRLGGRLALLLSVGTTICGGSAIAVTSPLIKAREEETSYAIGTIGLWGLVAIILYPKVFQLFAHPGMDQVFGVFAGTAIHSTPQVVGAGFIFSEVAGETATAVKLVRNTFIAPLAFIVALWYSWRSVRRSGASDAETQTARREARWAKVNWAKAFPWFLFGYFVMVALRTYGVFTDAGINAFDQTGRFLILVGMAGIGLNTKFSAFRGIGVKPLVVGSVGAVIVAGVSLAMIFAVGIGAP
ncbi:MAG: putative sulfate exporter family transporter [Armatimonadota bacterium]|jgi:uncharacterized integral membrane protein (TIGR00698 family)